MNPPSSLRFVPWRPSDVLVGLAVLLALRVGAEVVDPTYLKELPRPVVWALALSGTAWMLAYTLTVAALRSYRPRLPRVRRVVVEALVAVPTLLLIWVVLGAAEWAWEEAAGRPLAVEHPLVRAAGSAATPAFWVFAALAVTAAPVAEELFFRGFLYNALRQYLHPVVAAVLQAAAFGLLHPYGLGYAAVAGLLGLALAGVYEWRKTLLAPVFVHALQNTAVVMAALAVAGATPVLGVYAEASPDGARITRVVPGSGAEASGLRVGDVVFAVNGQPVADQESIGAVIWELSPGDQVEVEFRRGGEYLRAEAVLGQR